MFINLSRATPGGDDLEEFSDWTGKSLDGTSLDLTFYYNKENQRQFQEKQIEEIFKTFDIFSSTSKNYFKNKTKNSKELFEKSELVFVLILGYLYKNSIEIPKIRFSSFNDGIDINISGNHFKFLITVYEDVYALAYRDELKKSLSRQTDDIESIINTIKGIYEDDIKKLNIKRSISEYLYPEIKTGWSL